MRIQTVDRIRLHAFRRHALALCVEEDDVATRTSQHSQSLTSSLPPIGATVPSASPCTFSLRIHG